MSKDQTPAIREATGAFCRSLLEACLPGVRTVARARGYAVAVHGSLQRDIDLIAVPWTKCAGDPTELAQAIIGVVEATTGACSLLGEPSQKPHGRIAYTLVHKGFTSEIDLSVICPRDFQSTTESSNA